jgi:hypothetical protein
VSAILSYPFYLHMCDNRLVAHRTHAAFLHWHCRHGESPRVLSAGASEPDGRYGELYIHRESFVSLYNHSTHNSQLQHLSIHDLVTFSSRSRSFFLLTTHNDPVSPHLNQLTCNAMQTWTRTITNSAGVAVYDQPLVRVNWQ